MNKKLKPGDIVRTLIEGNEQRGLVMRDDRISGFLVAYPEHDELIAEHHQHVEKIGNIQQIEEKK